MIINSYCYTHPGDRVENQDCSRWLQLGPDQFIAVVCDGLGGHKGGSAASAIGVKALSQWAADAPLPNEAEVATWMNNANQEILSKRSSADQMKTTAVALYLKGLNVIWGHIGDTRLYHYWNGDLVNYTSDHSIAQLAIKLGDIQSRSDIPSYDGRSKLFRVIGDTDITPEIHKPVALQPGKHAFLLCSDGLWERLNEDEILLDLLKSESPEEWVTLMRFRAALRKNTDIDNNTAIAIWIEV